MATATALGLEGTLLYHLNLNLSALEVEARAGVIASCYGPLLELAERRPWLRFALAASGHTLERIARSDPEWIARLRVLLEAGRIELVGTGDTELIGALVPAAVNRWNQALGRETYLALLGRAPRLARVQAPAWSQGLLDAYLDAGYEGLVTDWSDPRRCHPEWRDEWRHRTAWTQSPSGRRIRVVWSEATLDESFRRAVAGEIEPGEYLAGLEVLTGARARHAFLHAGSAEAFGERTGELCDRLRSYGLEFATPGRVLDDERFAPEATLELCAAARPLALGREASLARWALAGWDNLGVNARCFARAKELERVGGSARDWQLLCRAWGADLRGPLTEKRWRRFAASLPAAPESRAATPGFEPPLRSRRVERAGARLAVGTDGVRVVLHLARGLALDSLILCHAGSQPLLGTLPPIPGGEGEAFSGETRLERPGEAPVTDLVLVEPEVEEQAHCVRVRALVPTALGPLPKEVRVHAQRLEIRYGFSAWGARPRGRLRTGALAVLDGVLGDELWISCANGGARERTRLTEKVLERFAAEPGRRAAFGATDGWIGLDDGRIGFEASWLQELAPALPLLSFRRHGARRLVRLEFALAEPDETIHHGAPLCDFHLSIRPYRNRR